MKREVFFLIGADGVVLWSDASDSPLALPDSRARWEAIWSRREDLHELAHSHPVGPDAFSNEDLTTMRALDDALGKRLRFSLVTPGGYFVRDEQDDAARGTAPDWAVELARVSGFTASGL